MKVDFRTLLLKSFLNVLYVNTTNLPMNRHYIVPRHIAILAMNSSIKLPRPIYHSELGLEIAMSQATQVRFISNFFLEPNCYILRYKRCCLVTKGPDALRLKQKSLQPLRSYVVQASRFPLMEGKRGGDP
jgi:hypothetical protein